jgi:hypothetical protein
MYLLGLITRHLKRTGMPESLFGRIVLRDPRFVSDLRNGREPGPRTIAKVCTYIADMQERRR